MVNEEKLTLSRKPLFARTSINLFLTFSFLFIFYPFFPFFCDDFTRLPSFSTLCLRENILMNKTCWKQEKKLISANYVYDSDIRIPAHLPHCKIIRYTRRTDSCKLLTSDFAFFTSDGKNASNNVDIEAKMCKNVRSCIIFASQQTQVLLYNCNLKGPLCICELCIIFDLRKLRSSAFFRFLYLYSLHLDLMLSISTEHQMKTVHHVLIFFFLLFFQFF